jgi:aryl-alcohol dehydrogenase-like predicted oxidoreductase
MSEAASSGTFKIGGELSVHRMGFGAMRITGPGIWGPPRDREEALRVLRRLPGLGVDFIDTADSYGPDVSEELIRQALHPYDGPNGKLIIATKAGFTRSGPDRWTVNTRPAHLKEAAKKSLKKLGVEQITLWQLHRLSAGIPQADQFGAVKELLDEGIMKYAGLSEVSVAEIRAAQKIFPVATVQNHYHLASRESDDVLDYCEAEGIGFIPWYPLGAGDLADGGAALDRVAKTHGATAAQIALAWLLKRSPVMLPIPGTSKLKHLEENVAASGIALSDEEFKSLRR